MLVREYEPLGVNVHCTMTALSIKSMDGLIGMKDLYGSTRKTNKITTSFAFVDGREFLHPGIFPNGFFDEDFDRIMQMMDDQKSKEWLSGYKTYLNRCQYKPELVAKLKDFLSIIDKRRNLDWRKTFKWLAEFDQDSIRATIPMLDDVDHPCLVQW